MRQLESLGPPSGAPWLDLDMSMGQLKAVMVLTSRGPHSIGGLGRVLAIGEPGASALVDKLVERGLAHRAPDPSDRRRTLVSPSEQGIELARRLRARREEAWVEWMDLMEPDDLDALRRGLEALVAAARTAPLPSPTEGRTEG
jgi:DNA-binding MarR family transcriptional regulator